MLRQFFTKASVRIVRVALLAFLLIPPSSQLPLVQAQTCTPFPGSPHGAVPCHDILPAPTAAQPPAPLDLLYRLAIYYVLPVDIPYSQEVYQRIREASYEIQAWYQVASGGLTWEFAYPDVVHVYHGAQNRQYYLDHGNWWGSLLPEMGDAGYPIWGEGFVTVLWAQGAGWWAGAAQGCGIDCGIALLGVELFPEFNNPAWSGGDCPDPSGSGADAWPCTPVGAYAHELGHTVGLIHPQDDPLTAPYASHSIMQTHWHYPDEAPAEDRPWGFLRSERQTLRANPFLKLDQPLIQRFEAAQIAVNLPISGTVPAAGFDWNASYNQIQLINATADADLFYWTFGDHQASNEFSPMHTYASSGVYTVTLRASNTDAMMGVFSKAVSIDRIAIHLPLVFHP
jgi:hypothetical protein